MMASRKYKNDTFLISFKLKRRCVIVISAIFGFAFLVFAAAFASSSKIENGNCRSVLSEPSLTVRFTFSRKTCSLLAS